MGFYGMIHTLCSMYCKKKSNEESSSEDEFEEALEQVENYEKTVHKNQGPNEAVKGEEEKKKCCEFKCKN